MSNAEATVSREDKRAVADAVRSFAEQNITGEGNALQYALRTGKKQFLDTSYIEHEGPSFLAVVQRNSENRLEVSVLRNGVESRATVNEHGELTSEVTTSDAVSGEMRKFAGSRLVATPQEKEAIKRAVAQFNEDGGQNRFATLSLNGESFRTDIERLGNNLLVSIKGTNGLTLSAKMPANLETSTNESGDLVGPGGKTIPVIISAETYSGLGADQQAKVAAAARQEAQSEHVDQDPRKVLELYEAKAQEFLSQQKRPDTQIQRGGDFWATIVNALLAMIGIERGERLQPLQGEPGEVNQNQRTLAAQSSDPRALDPANHNAVGDFRRAVTDAGGKLADHYGDVTLQTGLTQKNAAVPERNLS